MKFLLSIVIAIPIISIAQTGGESGYVALDLVTNPRTAALSGSSVSNADGDISQFYENPAVLDSVESRDIFFNVNPYFADVFVFSGAYAFDVKELGPFAAGLTYIDYGSFERRDASGNLQGTFDAEDYRFSLGKAHQLGPMTVGLNLNVVHSSIDNFGSTAILGDVGGIFRVTNNWTFGLVVANLGGRISNYTELIPTSIPLDVKVGTTFKPEYMPLRFTLSSGNLTQRNVVEESVNEGRSNRNLERVLRRINMGVELLLSENFQLLFGYNHKRKQELRLEQRAAGAGFSYGLMIQVKRIQLRFSRATFHAAGGSSFISLQANLNDFKRIL